MFRKISLFLALVLVIGALSACASAGLGTSQLSEEKKAEIEEAWYTFHQSAWNWAAEGDTKGCRYYGNFGGYDILFFQGEVSTDALTTIHVGESSFFYTSGFNMYAYKNETLYILKELYEDGKISADAVAQAAQYHKNDGKHLSLSADAKGKIELAMARMMHPINWNAKDRQPGAVRYYGTYNDFDILFIFPLTQNLGNGTMTVGEFRFDMAIGCLIVAYKDHSIQLLHQLYEDGNISDDALAEIAEAHGNYSNQG